jgi:hypothetical protein
MLINILTFVLFYEKARYVISALWTTEHEHFRSEGLLVRIYVCRDAGVMSPGAARSVNYCSTQGLLVAQWPPVALSRRMTICRHSCTFYSTHIIGNRGVL